MACVAACSSTDDTVIDASLDQSIDQANDVVTKDSGKDAGSDATDASTVDASDATTVDAPNETSLLDAPLDVSLDVALDAITLDAGGCKTNATCNTGDFCDKANGNCAGTGACMAKPANCPFIVNQVCGCDKKTYTNSCFANAAGMSIAYTGVCE